MTTILILSAIIFILVLVIYFTGHICKQLQAENFELKDKAEAQQKTIADLLRYAEEVASISQDKGTVQEKIANAKTDEELVAIANAIIDTNNSLRKQDKKGK